ncbi:FAD-linked oxidase C-terminal domain-containing protein [Actinomadura sp. 21ATH]|uniref:FAD-linked oxidase C-terminal domain-containing protein n=1 Tax=Actinomadura sp. 21ATH TaxID=1735444 RepID=UPI0035C0F032
MLRPPITRPPLRVPVRSGGGGACSRGASVLRAWRGRPRSSSGRTGARHPVGEVVRDDGAASPVRSFESVRTGWNSRRWTMLEDHRLPARRVHPRQRGRQRLLGRSQGAAHRAGRKPAGGHDRAQRGRACRRRGSPRRPVALRDILAAHRFDASVAGHVSAGNVHFTIVFDPADPADVDRYARCLEEIAALVLDRFDGYLLRAGDHP